jgi:glycosyltransferase involved in cell wall biosynthesis
MENKETIKVALIRGDSLNQWEGGLWDKLGENIEVTGFCGHHNLYKLDGLTFPIKKLTNTVDNFLTRQYDKFINARFQSFIGLGAELQSFHIAHTAEISYFFTNQAVRAKKNNPKLKVVTTVWDNSFGRFEYNYWPGFKMPPLFWRKKISSIIKENIDGVDIFLPITKYSSEMLLNYGVKENKIRILTPAVSIYEDVGVESLLTGLNLKGEDFCMAVCRLVKEKGVYDVLYAWQMYLKHNFNSHKKLLFIGSGPENENLIRLAGELGLSNSVIFIGRLLNDDVRRLYKKAKCLILASLPGSLWQEQFGYVLAEAISNDCPVISTYSGAIPEVIEDAGLLFSPGNPVELRDCLFKLDNAIFYEELKKNCAKIKNKFAVENFRGNLVNIYKELYS